MKMPRAWLPTELRLDDPVDDEIAVEIAFEIDGGIALGGGFVAGRQAHAAAQIHIAVDGGALDRVKMLLPSPTTETEEPVTVVAVADRGW